MFIIQLFTHYEMPIALLVLFAYIIALFLALTSHEFAHAFVAYKEGDMTAKAYGRLSFNPFKHIDLAGIIFLVLVGFGWAKPVPVNPQGLQNGRKSAIKVCIAGVITNLILSIVFSFLYCLTLYLDPTISFFLFLQQLCYYMVVINFMFFVFNLLPIYPLDGFNFCVLFLGFQNKFVQFMYKYGFWVLLFLLITNLFDYIANALLYLIINPLVNLWINLLF